MRVKRMINGINWRTLEVEDHGNGITEIEHGTLESPITRKSVIGLPTPKLYIQDARGEFSALL